MSMLMCCKKENNTCPKKEDCYRYRNPDNDPVMTLFKYACTEKTEYELFMPNSYGDNETEKVEGDTNES